MLKVIIPKTLKLIGEHLPRDLVAIIGNYFIHPKMGRKLRQAINNRLLSRRAIDHEIDDSFRMNSDRTPMATKGPRMFRNHLCDALHFAAISGYGEIVDSLMRIGVNIDGETLSCLYQWNGYGMYQVVINHRNFRNWPELVTAADEFRFVGDAGPCDNDANKTMEALDKIYTAMDRQETPEYLLALVNPPATNYCFSSEGCSDYLLGGTDSDEEETETRILQLKKEIWAFQSK